MMRLATSLVLMLSGFAFAAPEERAPDGGGAYLPPRQACLDDDERRLIREEVERSIAALRAEGRLEPEGGLPVRLSWPLQAAASLPDPGYHGISGYVDQNPSFPNAVLDYACGARSYDLASGYNHSGIDYFTWPFGWVKMDANAVEIVAAAPGTIVFKADGNFDRNCGFGSGSWNAVYVRHADNSVAWYGHMKTGSTTAKPVGSTVVAGEYLGRVGSSGNSTGPHLHFELYDGAGNLQEPYSGACNVMNGFSWWTAQRPYYDSAINVLHTHSVPPVFNACPTPETPNIATLFAAGQQATFATYYRDQVAGQTTSFSIRRPDGTVFQSWSHNAPATYSASYWYWTFTLPASPAGTWRFRAQYQGQTRETLFSLGTPGPVVDAVAPTNGPVAGGTPVTITGANFQAGATVSFGGAAATSVNVPSATTITATTSAHAAGVVSVVVTNPSAVSGTLPGAFQYTPPPTATSFYPIAPCRRLDTRQAGGPTGGAPLAGSSQTAFAMAGGCGIPASAKAVSLNVTVVSPAAPGFVSLYPGDGLPPLTSAVNFSAGQTRGNNAIVVLAFGGTGQVGVRNGATGSVHLVIDVNGYFQ